MMGRLLSPEQSESGRKSEDNRQFQSFHEQRFMNLNIPQHQLNNSFPPIDSTFHRRTNALTQRSSSSFSDMPPLQERSHSSYQNSHSAQSDAKEVRSSAVSPNLKLPPILSSKTASAPEVTQMPTQSNQAVLLPPAIDGNIKGPSLMDMKSAYENMMMSYFAPQSNKSESSIIPEDLQAGQVQDHNPPDFHSSFPPLPLPPIHQVTHQCDKNYTASQNFLPNMSYQTRQETISSLKKNQNNALQTCLGTNQINAPCAVVQHTSRDVTSSGCTLLNDLNFNECQEQPLTCMDKKKLLNRACGFDAGSSSNVSLIADNIGQSANNPPEHSVMVGGDQNTNVNDMTAVLDELSMFMPSQDDNIANADFSCPSNMRAYNTETSIANSNTCANAVSSTMNYQYPPKSDPTWGRFSVLPPVISSTTPSGGAISDNDNISLMSYNSVHSNAQNSSQTGMYYTPFSPFSVNFSDMSSVFAPSPRYSGRGSRNKRALSNSPLSAEGIDLNAIIRMSPTSLIAYINGSRSSSSCVSPGSIGERTGCYGHLSARNSSSSPTSGSNSSGNRRSTSYTPQTSTPGMSNSRSTQSNATSDNSNLSEVCNLPPKTDYINIDENLLVMQAMQDLEHSATQNVPCTTNFQYGSLLHPCELIPECDNLQVLPQDIATFQTEDFLPYVPSVLPPVHTHFQNQYQQPPSQQLTNISQHNKPPPTYDQHMARKAVLKKNSSSESSSQPSNSSSFESSEGDKTVGGNSSTDTESNRMYSCRWLDCTSIFQDQDEFVTHIEKIHVDQKKGEEFVCFWKLCPRRLHPFNARYKLLVHMRVHSGDKPNKCSYSGCKKAFSRLENLKIHLRSHTGERPYSCTYPGCTKTFSNSSDRTKHQKTHHDTKPYVCQAAGCDKRYTDPSSLRKHVKKSHPEKKEPDRKKIRGGVEELNPNDLSECLMIQAIKPITLSDSSPPDRTDSGLGRSPRGASSSDHYLGLSFANESFSRSETAQNSSSHTSPSSHHSSPPGPTDREKLPPNNNSLRVPILPPIVSSPTLQQNQRFSSPGPSVSNKLQTTACPTLESIPHRNSSALQQMNTSRLSDIYSPTFNNQRYKTPPLMKTNCQRENS